MKRSEISYADYLYTLYPEESEKMLPEEFLCRDITFQVTDDCPMACTYCYQGHKGHRMMSKETARAGVDLLFRMWEEDKGTFINRKQKPSYWI